MITIKKNQLNELSFTNDIFRRDINLLYRFKFYYPTRKLTKIGNFVTANYFHKWTSFTINETTSENLPIGSIDLLQVNSQWSLTIQYFDIGSGTWLDAYTDLVTIE